MKTKGLHTRRFADNPEEQRFAEAWADKLTTGRNLHHLLDPEPGTGDPPWPTERDEVVAATVIQWLGSPVGQGFLRDLGYVPLHKPKPAPREPKVFDFRTPSESFELHSMRTHGKGTPTPDKRLYPPGAEGLYLITMRAQEGSAPDIGDQLLLSDDVSHAPVMLVVVSAIPSPNFSSQAWILCAKDSRVD